MKILRPKSTGYIMLQLLIILPIIFFILALVFDFKELVFIVSIGGTLYLIFGFIPQELDFMSIYIKINNDYIFVPNQRVKSDWRTQNETTIYFNKISKIEIIGSINNSSDKKIHKLGYGQLKIKKYLQFILNDGTRKRIWIDYYTKKQVQYLLDLIDNYVSINKQEIMANWYSTFNEYKKLK